MTVSIRNVFLGIALLLTTICVNAHEFNTSLTWNKQGPMQAELYMAINSAYDCYRDLTLEQLGVEDVYEFLNSAYGEDIAEVQANPEKFKWVSASNNQGEAIGYASFEYEPNTKQVYVRQLAVANKYKRHGLASKIVNEGLLQYPEAKKVVIITRRVNVPALNLWKKLGFKESQYMHEGYDANKYVGFEKNL